MQACSSEPSDELFATLLRLPSFEDGDKKGKRHSTMKKLFGWKIQRKSGGADDDWGRFLAHHGIDYAADYGTPVWATADGVIVSSGRKGPLGLYVEVQHKNGYKTGYGHLSRISRTARKGVRVRQKQIVGYVGATGRATGPHLHYNFYSKVGGKYRLSNPSRVVNRPTGKTIPPALLDQCFAPRNHRDARLGQESGSIVTALLEPFPTPGLDYPT